MNEKLFHFFSYRLALRFHISRCLISLGWQRTEAVNLALFSDKNLTLNDVISQQLEFKHLLANLVQKNHLPFMPLTYVINEDNSAEVFAKMIYDHYLKDNQYQRAIAELKWILKPATLNNGDEIKLFSNVEELKKHYANPKRLGGDHVIQQYIANPHLIEGRKYTFRVAAVVTNYAGIFLYKQGYINLSAHRYDLTEGFANKKMHITNYVLDGEFAHIEQRSTQQLPNFSTTYQQMCHIITTIFRALLKKFPRYLARRSTKIFEIFGFDFMLDDQGKLWLLEINQSPDAPTFEENSLDAILWQPFWQDIIDDFVLPIALSIEPKRHYANYTQLLTPQACYPTWRQFLDQFRK